jgi:copper chaperone CopZ
MRRPIEPNLKLRAHPLFAPMLLWVSGLTATGSASGAEQSYEVRVQGMVCAYCTYSVGKRLILLPGVIAPSVEVDLEKGIAAFRSMQPLDDDLIRETFRDSGFTATDVSSVVGQAAPSITTQVVQLTLEADRIGSDVANRLLDTLGDAALKQLSEFRVTAPAALETKILKPLIAGRKQTIKVRYRPVEQATVEIGFYQ